MIETIAYDDVDLKAAIRDVTGGGADCVVDPVGGDKAERALRSLAVPRGRYLVVGFAAGQIPRLPLNQVLFEQPVADRRRVGRMATALPRR